ncbi:4-hydroxybenzoate transporter [Caballeronia glathei]|uniref:4-hydroxybenzoate transporter n=1 Tax=Caballeronia glathei TaxID=60547 RepID=A0A069PEW0_9BURK|nr:MFS transporter [Caballeronia glathei]KDR39105.1 4-hydroxybenzoate transporter [Caballeronia glathei]CDY78921.1 4-hydroxybenzoate transporter [Caballeronia glathei]
MSTPLDVSSLIDREPIRPYQWMIFILCFVTTLFDGFDTQAIAYTGPAIIAAFDLRPGDLAPILIAGTLGMTIGAMTLGLLGDRVGRRPALLGGVALFSVASLLTAFAGSTSHILILRFIAGLGMGGCTPVLLALAAEFGPARHRGAIMTGVLLGLPAGAMLGGLLAARMMPVIGWQGVFVVGGAAPLVLLVVLYFALPESLNYLVSRSRTNGMQAARRVLSRIVPAALPADIAFKAPEAAASRASVSALFTNGNARNTIAIWAVYLLNWIAWFMLLSWLPTVLKAAGLPAAQAPMGTVVVNAVFIVCAIPLSILLPRINTRRLLIALLALGIAIAIGLSYAGTSWGLVFVLAGAAGLGIGGQQIALNYLVVGAFPTTLRATATGWAIGMGRVGAIAGSAVGGSVLALGGPSGFFMALALPLVAALLAVIAIRTSPGVIDRNLAAAH